MCRWQVTPKYTYILDPIKLVWADKVGMEPIQKQAHTQLVREHLDTVVSARWALWTDPIVNVCVTISCLCKLTVIVDMRATVQSTVAT